MHGQAGHTRTHTQGTERASERRRAPSAAVAGRGPKLVIESLEGQRGVAQRCSQSRKVQDG